MDEALMQQTLINDYFQHGIADVGHVCKDSNEIVEPMTAQTDRSQMRPGDPQLKPVCFRKLGVCADLLARSRGLMSGAAIELHKHSLWLRHLRPVDVLVHPPSPRPAIRPTISTLQYDPGAAILAAGSSSGLVAFYDQQDLLPPTISRSDLDLALDSDDGADEVKSARGPGHARPLHSFLATNSVLAIRWHPQHDYLAVCCAVSPSVSLYNVASSSRQPMRVLRPATDGRDPTFTDGLRAIAWMEDVNVAGGDEAPHRAREGILTPGRYKSSGTVLCGGDGRGRVKLWDLRMDGGSSGRDGVRWTAEVEKAVAGASNEARQRNLLQTARDTFYDPLDPGPLSAQAVPRSATHFGPSSENIVDRQVARPKQTSASASATIALIPVENRPMLVGKRKAEALHLPNQTNSGTNDHCAIRSFFRGQVKAVPSGETSTGSENTLTATSSIDNFSSTLQQSIDLVSGSTWDRFDARGKLVGAKTITSLNPAIRLPATTSTVSSHVGNATARTMSRQTMRTQPRDQIAALRYDWSQEDYSIASVWSGPALGQPYVHAATSGGAVVTWDLRRMTTASFTGKQAPGVTAVWDAYERLPGKRQGAALGHPSVGPACVHGVCPGHLAGDVSSVTLIHSDGRVSVHEQDTGRLSATHTPRANARESALGGSGQLRVSVGPGVSCNSPTGLVWLPQRRMLVAKPSTAAELGMGPRTHFRGNEGAVPSGNPVLYSTQTVLCVDMCNSVGKKTRVRHEADPELDSGMTFTEGLLGDVTASTCLPGESGCRSQDWLVLGTSSGQIRAVAVQSGSQVGHTSEPVDGQ